MSDPAEAYLARLRAAVDIRLADDPGGWPALAHRADASVRGLPRDALSADERLLHAAAHALAGTPGRPDAADLAALHARAGIAEEDVPFAAVVFAARRDVSGAARQVYAEAMRRPLRPVLEAAVRGAVARAFPPSDAHAIAEAVDVAAARWPDWAWVRATRALEVGDDSTVAAIAAKAPSIAHGLEDRIGRHLRHTGGWRELLGGPDVDADAGPRLRLLAGALAWRRPVPSTLAPVIAHSARAAPGAAAALLVGCGDLAGAARVLPWPSGQLAIGEDSVTATIAQLGRDAAAVAQLWRNAERSEAPGRWLVIAMLGIELADRAALRQAATYLAPYAATPWGRALLARVHLGAGDAELASKTLDAVDADDPIARLLGARADFAQGRRAAAIAVLETLSREHPGWSEARWRHGAALAEAGEVGAAIAVLEAEPRGDDCGSLGPPATARAGALLTAAELHRRAGRVDLVEPRVRAAMVAAPASPMTMRRACVLGLALRRPQLADEAHRRLVALVPGARVADRLLGGVLELRGDVDGALARYDEAGAWDRALVLRAARGTPAPLRADVELDDVRSVAALHAVAVAAARDGRLDVAGDALARAIDRRPGHKGLHQDLANVRLAAAAAAVRSADDDGLERIARELRAAYTVTHDRRLEAAHAAVVLRLVERGLASGDLATAARARTRLDQLVAQSRDPRVAVHRAVLAAREGDADASERLRACDASEHARFLSALRAHSRHGLELAEQASDPRIAAAARFGGVMIRDHLQTPPDAIHELGAGAALLAADALVRNRYGRLETAAWLEEIAPKLDDGARRVRLAAAGLRALEGPVDLDDLDLDDLSRSDERTFATAIVAIEARRRRTAGDTEGARRALGLLATLRGPVGHIGLIALASIEDAAEAALTAWREDAGDLDALQTAAAVLLRRAIHRETDDADDEACLEAWEAFVAAAGPLLASDDAWRALASRRGRVLPQELPAAREHFLARVRDVLARLGKHHRERAFRLARVETLLTTEMASARAIHQLTLAGHDTAIELPLGPLGLDAHDRRADVIAALDRLSADLDDDERASLEIARGVLGGELVEGWLELSAGNVDEAERLARDGLRRAGDDAVRLLAAVYTARIHEARDPTDAVAHAVAWAQTGAGHLPDDLARTMIAAFRRYYPGYGLSRTRRAIGALRARYDAILLREHEAGLIAEHVDRKRSTIDVDERFALLVEACVLAPRNAIVQHRLAAAGDEVLNAGRGHAPARRVLDALAPIHGPLPPLVQLIQAARARVTSREVVTVRGRLRWTDDDGEAHVFDLGDDTIIGRHPDCTLQLLERIVAKQHCRILREGVRFVLHDMRSPGGTFVNGERVIVHTLVPGDRIRVGTHVLELE